MAVYWQEIKDILAPGIGCMQNVPIPTDQGVFLVKLDDYATVKQLHQVIAAAINAWQRDATGTEWATNAQGFIRTKEHAMPPGGPLPITRVDAFLQWVADGMPEAPLVA